MLFVSATAAVRDMVFLYGLSDSANGAIGFAQRSAGGGVSLYNSSATFDNVTFRCVHSRSLASDFVGCSFDWCAHRLQRQPRRSYRRRRRLCGGGLERHLHKLPRGQQHAVFFCQGGCFSHERV